MRYTAAAVRVRDGEVDAIVCSLEIFDILLEHTYGREFEDGWYAFTLMENAEGSEVQFSTALVPLDNLPELG